MRKSVESNRLAGPLSATVRVGTVLVFVAVLLLVLGCKVSSINKTRSFMSEDELVEIDAVYNPVEVVEEVTEEGEEPPARVLQPFLGDVLGPALKVNGLVIYAEDIRALYEYYGTFRDEDDMTLQQEAIGQWMLTYAVMSQWPDAVQPTLDRMDEILAQVEAGTDFENLVMENSQDPDVRTNRGDLGEIRRGQTVDIFEMHAFTDPILEVVGPFPDIFGWHLIQVLGRVPSMQDPEVTVSNPRHLLLFHGLSPGNGQVILQNLERYKNTAEVELLHPELREIMPWYAD